MEALVPKLILDLVVTVLLAVTIFYCTKLNKRIRVLQDSKSELASLISQFDASTQQATRSINEIHTVSKKINESMKTKLEKANYIVDDLAFMIEKGNKLADRMEADISGSRKPLAEGARASVRGRAAEPAKGEPLQLKEEEPQNAPRLTRRVPRDNAPGGDTEKARRNAGLESMLEKIAQKKAASAQGGGEVTQSPARKLRTTTKLRSKAEQELYDALKSEH